MTWLSSAWSWIKDKWNKFEAWVYTWMPGFKTYIASGLGMVGSGAAVAQEYVLSMPVPTFVTAGQLSIASFVLFTLAFWFHGMGSRVQLPNTNT